MIYSPLLNVIKSEKYDFPSTKTIFLPAFIYLSTDFLHFPNYLTKLEQLFSIIFYRTFLICKLLFVRNMVNNAFSIIVMPIFLDYLFLSFR
jgi:hypothetical protein